MRKLSAISIILSFIFLFAQRNPISAQGVNIGEFNIQTGNEARRQTEEAASQGKTEIHGQVVNEYQQKAAIYNVINLIQCTDETNCKPNETAMGNLNNIMASLYTHPPASLALYAHDVLANANIIAKPAYAQGIGFTGLLPLLPLWKMTRNIAYIVLIIVMVAIGFMVIFRMKIDPKTIISVQAALPKIVIALLMITLSYAIVGFLIDLMYVVIAITVSIIGQGVGYDAKQIADTQRIYMTGQLGALLGHVMSATGASLNNFWKILILGQPSVGLAEGLVGIWATRLITSAAAGWWTFIAPALIITLIIVLGLLFTFIRLAIILLNSYIQILISLILGPIILLGEAVPGKSTMGGWVMNILANLIVFPTTAAILMLAHSVAVIYGSPKLSEIPNAIINGPAQPLWYPPLTLPGGEADLVTGLLSMGIIFLAPTLVVSVKKMFNPKPAIPMTAGTVLSPITGSFQSVTGAAGQFYYMQQMPFLNKFLGGNKPQHQRPS